jgi:hypothetical protein
MGGQPNPRGFYLILLFALCSTSLIDLDGFNGRYALLSIFLGMYFVYFGVQDLTNLFNPPLVDPPEGLLSPTELVILVGGVMLVLGYRLIVRFRNSSGPIAQASDWPLRSILFAGIALWLLGTGATYFWYFHVVTDKTLEGTKGIALLSPTMTAALVLAQMLQPLGTLLLAYAWRSTKATHLLVILLLTIAVQVLFGFVIDIKGMALAGGSLVVATIIFTDGRLPKAWIAGIALFIYVAFPVFQAYRAVVTGNGVARTEVLENLGKTLDVVLAAKERVNTGRDRAQTIFERLSLKGSVHMIVHGTANGVPLQHGFTLTPILSTFLPKILWTDKPDVPTGRIVNRVFNVTDQDETYISPSHLGELYWNFGWPGVIVGMTLIGVLCGFVARFNLAECRTVTRLLIMVVTVEMVIHGFEGSLAGSYVVFLRMIAAIGLLHWLLARVKVVGDGRSPVLRPVLVPRESAPQLKTFPHLLN